MGSERAKTRVVVVVRAAGEVAPAEEPASAATPADEPAAAPPVASPESDWIPAEPWTPPVTFSDRFSTWSRRAIRAALIAGLLLGVAVLLLWGIPTWRVSSRPGFQAVRTRALNDPGLSWLVFEPRRVDRFPRWFSIRPDGERYELVVRGPAGQRAVVRAIVRDGRIVRFYAGPEFDAREGYQDRTFRKG